MEREDGLDSADVKNQLCIMVIIAQANMKNDSYDHVEEIKQYLIDKCQIYALLTSQLTDKIPNPFQAMRVLRCIVERLKAQGMTTKATILKIQIVNIRKRFLNI
ncbi:MAG: hypothetical protein AB8B77_03045 [Alphaproteobacteria bacterium]